jgi:hypothetical protein
MTFLTGTTQNEPAEVTLIAATSKGPLDAVRERRFREDVQRPVASTRSHRASVRIAVPWYPRWRNKVMAARLIRSAPAERVVTGDGVPCAWDRTSLAFVLWAARTGPRFAQQRVPAALDSPSRPQ